ncbi:hypothetical protein F2Q70_00034887 [Brassica cretica]|uniref:Uncharacterized protein n=1 Tax=Brassica cretica TaxID=69181 RepID=A0A8S9G6Z9_BRACR|nr:hypothetical protein F2Q68_00029821 [Brassica cretica]KAF2584855.1 hypothetical protein F2Q70_00034887 [Brassica cretica]
MWSLKKADLQLKERLSKMRMLESLVAKQAPLVDYDEALKKKLIAESILFKMVLFFFIAGALVDDRKEKDHGLIV